MTLSTELLSSIVLPHPDPSPQGGELDNQRVVNSPPCGEGSGVGLFN